MKIAIGSDHGGFALKGTIISFLKEEGHTVIDLGAYTDEPSDYPDYAKAVALALVARKAQKGIIVCGSGVGACITANKIPGIRAAICHDAYSARQGVEHDDMNLLCLGERVIGREIAREVVRNFVLARFSGKPKYKKRLEKLKEIENSYLKKCKFPS